MLKEIKKDKNMLCGSACLRYIFAVEDIPYDEIPNMEWVIDIACYCNLYTNLSTELLYCNSEFMKSLLAGRINDRQDIIEKIMILNGKIKEEKVTPIRLKKYIDFNKWIILNVDSDVFFQDPNLRNHSHFVIAQNY